MYVWHRLDHLNVAKMFGTSYHMGARPVGGDINSMLDHSLIRMQAIVLEWYQNGNASEYLKKNPTADRKMLVINLAIAQMLDSSTCLLKIHDIARGLNYLHTLDPPIVHGDLKGVNNFLARMWFFV